MLILFVYLAALIGLLVVLGLILNKTLAMVRDGRPLVAVGALEWYGNAPRAKAQAQPHARQQSVDAVKPGRLAALSARLRPTARVVAEPVPEGPPRERSRRLASLSEFRAAELGINFAVSTQPAADFAAGIEQQIESELDRLCAGMIDLPTFAAFVAAQQAELDGHFAAAPDPETTAALEAAAAVIAFSHDWVSQQR